MAFPTLFLIILLALGAGCELLPIDPGASQQQAFEVHLQNNFDNDRVRVEIDGDAVFDERVSTDYRVSLAEVIELEEPEGTHRLRVVVNESETGENKFYLDQKLYVGVRYYEEAMPDLEIPEGVVINVREEPYPYD